MPDFKRYTCLLATLLLTAITGCTALAPIERQAIVSILAPALSVVVSKISLGNNDQLADNHSTLAMDFFNNWIDFYAG